MTAIPAASVGVKDMADSSLRITLEFEPRYAKDAFALFGARGTQVAIAALRDGSFLEHPEPEPNQVDDRENIESVAATKIAPRAHIGDACYRSVLWCQEPTFWAFLNQRHPGLSMHVNSKNSAAEMVKEICDVVSRKELDTDNEANKAFHRLIREPYRKYLEALPQ